MNFIMGSGGGRRHEPRQLLAHKRLHPQFVVVPTPDAIWRKCQILPRIELEVLEPHDPLVIAAAAHVPMPEVDEIALDIRDTPLHRVCERLSPVTKMALVGGAHPTANPVIPSRRRAEHQLVSSAEHSGVVEPVGLEQFAACSPCPAGYVAELPAHPRHLIGLLW